MERKDQISEKFQKSLFILTNMHRKYCENREENGEIYESCDSFFDRTVLDGIFHKKYNILTKLRDLQI